MPQLSSLTSDYDYLKVLDDALLSISTGSVDSDFSFPTDPFGGGGFLGVATINHNLGYVPIVRAFIDPTATGLWYSSQASIGNVIINPLLMSLVSSTTLKLAIGSDAAKSNIPVWYRIYKTSAEGITSDDRIDKVFSKSSTTASVGAAGSSSTPVQQLLTLPHNQGEPIIWRMQFSADGVSWFNDGNFIYGPPDTASGPPGGPYSYYYYLRAYASGDDNNFYLRLEHNYPSTKVFYLRWALDYRS